MSTAATALDLAPAADQHFSLRRLQPAIGAEIGGIDLRRPLNDATRDAIRAAVVKHKVVFFRDQNLNNDEHAAFASRFGPLYTHPSTKRDDKISALHKISASELAKYTKDAARAEALKDGYHTDTSWRLVPTWGAVLRAVNLPEVGGDTIWVDAAAAYEGLPSDVKERLAGLHVTHDYRDALVGAGHDYPIVAHPVVRVHRESGEKVLWVNFSQKPFIIGLDRAESRELLAIILQQYKQPEYQVRFSWSPGSIAFWDNRAAVHYAVRNYGEFPRLLERILIQDEPLYGNL
jgi:alpha-ketoglutarate-dependent taurine dioxygenase